MTLPHAVFSDLHVRALIARSLCRKAAQLGCSGVCWSCPHHLIASMAHASAVQSWWSRAEVQNQPGRGCCWEVPPCPTSAASGAWCHCAAISGTRVGACCSHEPWCHQGTPPRHGALWLPRQLLCLSLQAASCSSQMVPCRLCIWTAACRLNAWLLVIACLGGFCFSCCCTGPGCSAELSLACHTSLVRPASLSEHCCCPYSAADL